MAKICGIQKKNDYAIDYYSVEIKRHTQSTDDMSTYDGVLNVFREVFKCVDFVKIIKR